MLLAALGQQGMAQTFLRTSGLPNRNERGLVLHRTPAGAIFLGGSVADSALVQRIDADGNVLWSRAFKPPGQYPKMVYHMADAPDGTIIGCGNGLTPIAGVYEGFHFKFDIDGNFQWIRTWTDGLAYNREVAPYNATEMIMFSVYYPNGGSFADYFQSHIDLATGNVTWMSPRYDLYPAVPYIDDVVGVVRSGASFYSTGRIYTNGSPVSTCRVNLTKLDGQGQHLWTRYLIYPNNISRRMYGCDIIATNDSLTIIYVGDVTGASGNLSVGMIRTDTLGNVAWARDYNIGGSANEHCSQVIPTAFGYVIMGRTVAAPNQHSFLMGISFVGDLLWTKMYGAVADVHVAPHTYLKSLVDMGDGYLFAGVSRVGADDNVLLVRTDQDGLLGCVPVSDPVVVTTVLPTATFSTAPVTYPLALVMNANVAVPGLTTVDDACALQFDLGPDTTVCAQVVLHASMAGAAFTWQDGSTTDSLVVTAPGTYWVTASVGCCTVTDTVDVFFSGNLNMDLGPDTAVCDLSTVMFTVDQQWSTVQWSTGPMTDTLLVTTPGTYWVDVELNGCTATDTVLVFQAEGALMDLGPDTLICPGSVLVLELDTAWSAVLWSDGSASDTLVVTAPGSYWAQAAFGICPASDTIVVDLVALPPLDLGPDTSLCDGTGLLLGVDPLWDAVLWSDGSILDSTLIGVPGLVEVAVTLSGCVVADSLSITWTLAPLVDLGPDSSACEGDAIVIGTGLLGLQHTWQDGSSNETFAATSSGTYWVEVGDPGCTNSDTVVVTLYPVPIVDLGPDTSFCAGASVLLGPVITTGALNWSDGTSGASLTVVQAGTYWVIVDEQGCTASDTVDVVSIALPQVVLGADTTVCDGSPVQLAAVQAIGGPLLWSTGDATPTTIADISGTYWLSVANACGVATDTVMVSIVGPVTVDLGADTVVCGTVAILLASNYAAPFSTWNTGLQSTFLPVTAPGTYWVDIDVDGCTATDTIVVDQQALPQIMLAADTVLCAVAPLTLAPITFTGDLLSWSDGSSAPSITVSDPGSYSATASNQCGEATDEMLISLAAEFPIAGTYLTCIGEPVHVVLPTGATYVVWSNGSDLPTVDLFEGAYTFQYIDLFGCAREGAVEVFVDPAADGLAFAPNVFTPNADEVNDVFAIVGADALQFELSVFNRWGELVFHSVDPVAVWDGTFGGSPVPDGTYVYLLHFADPCDHDRRVERKGHVSLLR